MAGDCEECENDPDAEEQPQELKPRILTNGVPKCFLIVINS